MPATHDLTVTTDVVSRTNSRVSNRLRWVWCALTCVLAAGSVASCGDSEKTPTAPTAPAAAGQGGAGGVGQVMAGNAGEGGAVPPEFPTLGKTCLTSAVCGAGLICLSARDDFRGSDGGPAGGLCTQECETDADCRALGRGAVCGTVGEVPFTDAYPETVVPRVCLLGCELGSQSGTRKCQDRADLACRPFTPANSVECGEGGSCPGDSVCFRTRCRRLACGPRCNDSADCEVGRYCDPVSGICTANEPDPIPWGRECDDLSFSPGCGGGSCLVTLIDYDGAGGAPTTRLKGNCTQSCTLGQPCGDGAGACIRPRSEAFGAGDIGYCSPLCNCDSECVNPVDRCLPWADAAYEAAFGSRGYCEHAESGEQTLDCSGAGGALNEGGAAGHAGSP
jgi:hypothetical protein